MITPVLLSGGSGTRLWPLSRKSYPKQFVPLVGDESLFQASARRLSGEGYGLPLVLTNADFRFIVAEQLQKVDIDPGAILIEPEGRNTAPAILAAALWLERSDSEALMLIAPSDHVVPDPVAFRAAVQIARPAAEHGKIVTFGITPGYAETGYGYLELAEEPGEVSAPIDLLRFIEKPTPERAQEMIASGTCLWNAGIFLVSAATMIKSFRQYAPALMDPVEAALADAKPDLGFLRLDPAAWSRAEDISIDYAVMEKSDDLAVVPFSGGWSDLGGWDAVLRASGPDENGVALSGNATAIECADTLLRSEDDRIEIVGIGLNNIVAIATPDAVLVADASRSQDVKLAVSVLKAKGARQAEASPRDHRPWGWYETLALSSRFQVKRIVVLPGGVLSLQSHHHRSEHWIVVEGTARVKVGDEVKLVTENQSVYVPLGVRHRLENPGKLPMTLIEVQTGPYLGEDDIIRYEDAYARQ
ncbi:mannose-1-phosphate guanylyltransferase/mannose-6-phosphate isomerase [Devosia sp. RR2S18]|uniref:mannose-1-phosphate guanylyltransferase/mannose-6-phosphate isomerase n=1 Tax=Devosia rhizosphaerae TaxID=3049774 RepID=UPI002540A6D5|nr:mannose-1-phosphate guanylyltransferase/mannose-6-phosphate isomerase [Devosia sp. RR2S18]WIJ23924.1 mannose-1-phosphate guanylyltransferase/mannose-6-phosphate isomerase [Devosia sp. RR2S18]